MGQPRPVGLAPAGSSIHAGEQRGVGDVARGGAQPLVLADAHGEPGSGVSVDHRHVRPRANAHTFPTETDNRSVPVTRAKLQRGG